MHRKFVAPYFLTFIAIGLLIFGIFKSNLQEKGIHPSRPVMLATLEWEPFVGSKLDGYGPASQIVTETLYRMGHTPHYTFYSWDICVDKAKKELVVGTFPALKSEHRDGEFIYSAPLFKTDYVLFYLKSEFPTLTQKETRDTFNIKHYDLGKVEGYQVWKELDSLELKFKTFSTMNAAFIALAEGDVDFIPEGKVIGLKHILNPDIGYDATKFACMDVDTANPIFGVSEEWRLMLPCTEFSKNFRDKFNANLDPRSSYYDDLIKKINSNSPSKWQVELLPSPGNGFIELRREKNDDELIKVPLGTKAVVLKWPDQFLGLHSENKSPYCEVKLLNGPLQGRVMYADPKFISLTTISY